jgi:hypothetical protein
MKLITLGVGKLLISPMVWIARSDKNPEKKFFYIPQKVEKDRAILKIVGKDGNISAQQGYEIFLPVEGTLQKFIGTVEEIKNSQLVVKIKPFVRNRRKFNRIKLTETVVPIAIFIDRNQKPITGLLEDISLGGFKVKISPNGMEALKKVENQNPVTVLFRLLNENDLIIKTFAIPVRFDEKDNTVAFTFSFRADNGNVLKVYESILKAEGERD